MLYGTKVIFFLHFLRILRNKYTYENIKTQAFEQKGGKLLLCTLKKKLISTSILALFAQKMCGTGSFIHDSLSKTTLKDDTRHKNVWKDAESELFLTITSRLMCRRRFLMIHDLFLYTFFYDVRQTTFFFIRIKYV